MSKPQTPSPALRKPPKPSLAAVDAFVGGGSVPEAPSPSSDDVPSRQAKPSDKASRKGKALRHPEPPTQVKQKRLTVDVPIDHWWALKTKSMHEGRSLQEILADAVSVIVEG